MPSLGAADRKITGSGAGAPSLGVADRKITAWGLGFKLCAKLDACFVSAVVSIGPTPALRVRLVSVSWHPTMVTATANRISSEDKGKVESSLINESDS